ncbi:MAG TPA: DUF167 family protein [Candidatus Paceibacterota bacterium]|nr:DUF167 family protein [Candidatus Paceibacterota bacterium]
MHIKVKVFPESRKEELREIKPNTYECFLRARARNNEANKRVLEILKLHFPDSRGMRIVRGIRTQNKTIEIFSTRENLI